MIKPWSMTKSSSPTREVRENTRDRRTARENVPDVLLDVTSTQWSNQSACASVACFQTVKAKCCLIDNHTGEYVAVGKAQKALCTKILSFFFLLLFHFTDLNERSDVFFFPHILRDSGCFLSFPWCAAGKKLLHCACFTFDPCVFVVFCRVLVCQSLFVKPVSLITFL